MSTSTRIEIGVDETGLLGMKQTPEAAAKVSALLQEDVEVRFFVPEAEAKTSRR